MNILIVGGGKASLNFIEYFQDDSQSRIIGVIDTREDAVGIMRARELGLSTGQDIEAAVRKGDAELVMDLTGESNVENLIRSCMHPHQDIISVKSARLMWELIEVEKQKEHENATVLGSRFKDLTVQLATATRNIDSSLQKVNEVLRFMRIIALNAGIEAAKAGAAGKGFGVIAEEMGRMAANATQALDSITLAAQEAHSTLKNLNEAETQFAQTFGNKNQSS